jgi:PAS domain S-box-containing protein
MLSLHSDASDAALALQAWRERTVALLFRLFLLVVLPLALINAVNGLRLGRGASVGLQLAATLVVIAIGLARPRNYRLGGAAIVAFFLCNTLIGFYRLGLFSINSGLLCITVVLAVLLLGRRAGLVVVALGAAGIALILAGFGLGLIPYPYDSVLHATEWPVIGNNLLLITGLATLLAIVSGSLVASLQTSLGETRRVLDELERVNSSLEEAVEARTEELRGTQALLQGFLDNSPAAAYVKDRDGRYLLTNVYMQQINGLNASGMLGRRDVELFGEAVAAWRQHDQAVLETGQTVAFESEMRLADGPHTYLEIKFPLRDAQGSVTAVGGIAADISDRKRSEQTLARQLRLQAAVARCARTLLRTRVTPRQRDAFLAAVFDEFRLSAGVDYVGLYAFQEQGDELRFASIVQLPGPATPRAGLPFASFRPEVAEALLRGDPVSAPTEQAFTPDAALGAAMRRRNLAGMVATQVAVDGRPWGFAGFGLSPPYRQLDAEELSILTALAEVVGAFLSNLEAGAAIERQRAHAQALTACSGALLARVESPGAAGDALIDALEHLRAVVGCLRAYVYELRRAGDDGFAAVAVAEACAPGAASDPRTAHLPGRLFPPALIAELAADRVAHGPVATLLAASPDYVCLLDAAGVGSTLYVPLHLNGCLWGFLGLSDADAGRAWGDDETRMLRTAGEIVASFLHSRQLLGTLRERDHFIQRVTDASPDVLYVYDLSTQRNVFANREIATTLGYDRDDVHRMGSALLQTLMVPEDFARLPDFQARSLAAADNEVVEFDYRVRRKEGGQRWLLSREVVFARDESGRPTQVLGLARDITSRKEAELELERRESLLRTINDALPNGYLYQVAQRADGSYLGYTYVSGGIEPLLGISPADAVADSRLVHETILPADRPAVDAADRESVETLSAFDVEMRRRMADGRVGWFHARSVPRPQADGVILWNGVCLDITPRKAAELALVQANGALHARVDELATLNRIAQALMGWTDLPAALKTVGALLLPLFAAEQIAIWLREERHEALSRIGLIGRDAVELDGPSCPLRDAPLARAALSARRGGVIGADRADPVVLAAPEGGAEGRGRSALVQPLLVRGRSIGLLVVHAAAGRPTFTPADVELAQTIAALLSSAIENGRLLRQTMAEAAREERRRLARELHDSVTQSLYSMNLLARSWSRLAAGAAPAEVADWFGQIQGLALQSLKEMRLLIYQLRSEELEEQGLVEVLRHRLEAVEARSGVKVELDAAGYERPPSPGVEPQLFAIVQEALNNALRHADATAITIALRSDAEAVTVVVRDDGRGFDAAEPSAGLGLTTMRERAEALGGTISVSSAPGAGTAVRVTLGPAAPEPRGTDGAATRTRRRKR